MKVLMLVDKPLPSERPTGIGVAAFNMALALSKHGILVQYLCRGSADNDISASQYLKIRTIRRYTRSNLRKTIETMGKDRPDIVHVHSSSAFPSLLIAKLLCSHVVFHSHANWKMPPVWPALMRRVSAQISNRVVAVSKVNREDIIRTHHLQPSSVSVVYNGVDVQQFAPSPVHDSVLSRYGIHGPGPVLLSIGTLQRKKGQWAVIESLPKLKAKWPDVVYVNVGEVYDEDYREEFLSRAEELRVSRSVILLRGIPLADLVALINLAAVCVQPSLREPFGLAIVEEMACGKPVLSFESGAFPEIVRHGSTGWMVEPGNLNELTSALHTLLEDPSLQKRLGENARADISRRFTWDNTASALEAVYIDVLHGT
jgi:glycosyltransferase involved in cell wall biosynthesis